MTEPVLKGLVLAGGDSRRMGSDKAAREFSGQSLLDRAVSLVSEVVDETCVSAREQQRNLAGREHYRLIPDSLPFAGPAAGILSAHCADRGAAWLVLACDMPMVTAHMLRRLVAERDASAAATAWIAEGREQPEPLCAVYEPATLAAFLEKAQAGECLSPLSWLNTQPVKLLAGAVEDSLSSANTPEELERMQVVANSVPRQE
jgi:molybdopterin-guanine dinucleotide biosynthesis protein A